MDNVINFFMLKYKDKDLQIIERVKLLLKINIFFILFEIFNLVLNLFHTELLGFSILKSSVFISILILSIALLKLDYIEKSLMLLLIVSYLKSVFFIINKDILDFNLQAYLSILICGILSVNSIQNVFNNIFYFILYFFNIVISYTKYKSFIITHEEFIKNFYYLFTFVIFLYFVKGVRKFLNREKMKRKEFESISNTDQLTKINNRRKIESTLEYEFRRSKRYKRNFSIIIIDIDEFKAVNDTYGHLVGDSVLIEFSEILKLSIRNVDFVGRWGGEEFLIICPETSLNNAKILSERLRFRIQEHKFEVVLHKTASFGIASLKEEDENLNDLIKRADDSLYLAKRKGRNRIEHLE